MPVPAVLTILRTIKDRGSISRTDLQQLTGLSWGTITNTTRDLLTRRLIREEGATATKAGRKPVRLALNRLTHALIGLHLDPDRLRLLALNLTGETLIAESLPLDSSTTPAAALAIAADRIKAWRSSEELLGRTILGVGAALPGIIDPAHGILRSAPHLPAWKNVAVRSLLQHSSSLPVRVERTANCLALAERWFGNGGLGDSGSSSANATFSEGEENLLCLLLDRQIDLGILLGGKVFHGSDALAGNLAHLPLLAAGPLCPICHQRGCLSSLAAPDLFPAPDRPLGDPAALADALEILARQLVMLFDPDALMLAGELPSLHPSLRDCATKGVQAARKLGHNAELLAPAVLLDAPAMGACGLILDAAFDSFPLSTSAALSA